MCSEALVRVFIDMCIVYLASTRIDPFYVLFILPKTELIRSMYRFVNYNNRKQNLHLWLLLRSISIMNLLAHPLHTVGGEFVY